MMTLAFYALSLHDALPIFRPLVGTASRDIPRDQDARTQGRDAALAAGVRRGLPVQDRKSTRLNSSHLGISYAVFCLKKKTQRSVTIRNNLMNTASSCASVI